MAPSPTATPDVETELANLSGLSLAELLTIENPVLAHSMRKVLAEEQQRQNIVAGFQSAI